MHDKLLLKWNRTKLNLNHQLPPVSESQNANVEQWYLFSLFFQFPFNFNLVLFILNTHTRALHICFPFYSICVSVLSKYTLSYIMDLLVGCSISSTYMLTGKSFPFNKSMLNKLLSNALRLFVHSINIHTKENTDNKCIFSIKYWLGNELLNLFDFFCKF